MKEVLDTWFINVITRSPQTIVDSLNNQTNGKLEPSITATTESSFTIAMKNDGEVKNYQFNTQPHTLGFKITSIARV